MMVLAVGPNSQKGKISALLDTPHEDTPLTKKLETLAESI
jgi:magnesium-transporting ATPase (P-type)